MQTRKIRIGLLGFGSMGKVHTYAVNNLKFFYRDLPFSAEIAGVCTTSMKKSQAVCDEYGIPFATTNEMDLISSPDIDVIDICTPNNCHFSTLKAAILAGKHIYCEKPLCITEDQAEEILRLTKEHGCGQIHNIVFNNRFLAPIMRAKQLVDEGKIGRILSFSASYLHSSALNVEKSAGWKQNADICGGGVLFDLGSHVIDLVYHLCGEFDSVCAMTQIAYAERAGMDGSPWKTNADEAFYMLTRLKNGACGTISASKVAVGANDDISLEISGEKGALRFSLMDPNWLYFYDNTLPEQPLGGSRGYTRVECVGRYPEPGGSFPSPKASSGWLRGHVGSMYHFLDSVYHNVQDAPDFRDGAYVQSVMAAAYRSAELGIWQSVKGV